MSDSKKENTVENVSNFTPYGTDPKKDKMVKSNYWGNRLEMAEEGYGLDILINDEDWGVREAVAGQGYGLDVLINDEDWGVREAVAKQGYSLNILVNDKDSYVREAVAEQGYGLDVLINDKDFIVRAIVAKQGYGLDILVNDKHKGVRQNVFSYLGDNNLNLAKWCNQNNKEIDFKKLTFSSYPEVRAEAVKSGYVYKKDEIYVTPDCKFTSYGTNSEKDKMVKSNYWEDRLEMAEEGYGLDILINDEDWGVREAVADQGYGLNVLINDEDYDVRKAALDYLKENNLTLSEWCNQNNKEIDLEKLAFSPYLEARIAAIESGYFYKKGEIYINSNCKFIPYGTNPGKDKMIKSNNWKDRLEMAKESYGLDVLINDEDCDVREAVVEQGYGLDVLINDEHWKVRTAVKNYLTSHNLTLEQWKSNQDLSETNIINQAKNAISDGKIDIKNVADNIKSTKSILNDSMNKTNKTNEIELFKLD